MAVLLVVLPPQGRRNETTLLEIAQLPDRSPSAPALPPDRCDELDDRRTRTVSYARGDRRIADSIVAGRALAWPANARRAPRDGSELRHNGMSPHLAPAIHRPAA